MCIPKPNMPAPQPSLVPQIQSATDLNLGGAANRGAAGLGRLALRLGAPSSATVAAPSVATSVPTVTPAVTSAPDASSVGPANNQANLIPSTNLGGLLGQRLQGGIGATGGFLK